MATVPCMSCYFAGIWLAIVIGLSVYAICCIILIYNCFLKRAYLVTPCTICFLLSVSVLTCVLDDTIISCLIIVLYCIKYPLLFVHYLNLLNLFNCIVLLTSYAMSLFWCACVASILKVTYLLTYLLTYWLIFSRVDTIHQRMASRG